MKENMSARFYSPIVLTNKEIKTNSLSITNEGDTSIVFQPKNYCPDGNKKTFIGIDLEIPYGNSGSDLMSKNDVDKISILSETNDIDVIKIKGITSKNCGKVVWRIYPLENVVIDSNEAIKINVHSVKTNSSEGTVKISLCIYNDKDKEIFDTYIEKKNPPEIIEFSAKDVSQMIKGFISLETVANEENECIIIRQPYMGPDAPSHPPGSSARGNEFRVKWKCINSVSCKLSYGESIDTISCFGEKTLDIGENIKTIKLTAYGKEGVGSAEKEIALRN